MKTVVELLNALKTKGLVREAETGEIEGRPVRVATARHLAAYFARQAQWQRDRARLSWTEKLRLAATLRDAALAMRPAPRRLARPAARPAPPVANGA